MGKLIVTEFVTLDGVAQAPGEPDEDRDDDFTHGGCLLPGRTERAGATAEHAQMGDIDRCRADAEDGR